MDELYIKGKEKTFGDHVIEIKILELQKKTSNVHEVAVIGFPADEGTRIIGGRCGAERGPSVFRSILKSAFLCPFENIERLCIYDTGDICSMLTELDLTLEKAHQRLEEASLALLSRTNSTIPFVIGGSNDQSYPNAKALLRSKKDKEKIAVINIDAHFDVRDKIDDKVHSGSPFRLLLEDTDFTGSDGKFVEFASQGSQCSLEHTTYLSKKNASIYWLDKDIRRSRIQSKEDGIYTQAGKVMSELLTKLSQEYDSIFFSFDLDSINGAFCPGVSSPSVIGGLTDEEAVELAYLAGRCEKVSIMDVSEFNPAVESKRSGNLIVHMFYSFCKGVTERAM